MSEAADFEAAAEDAHAEDAELEGVDAGEVEDAEVEEKPAKDWEKIAHDREGAVAKERSRRKAADVRARQLEERLDKLESQGKATGDDTFEKLVAQLRDDDDDPINDINAVKAIVREFLAGQKADKERETGAAQQQRQVQKLISTMESHEADFAEDHPDYHKAAQHYRADRQSELEELGYSGQQLQQALARDLFGIVQTALGAGRDPAEAVYKLAAKRGFASGASGDEAAAKLKKLQESADAGRRPSGGKPTGGNLTWGDVSKLKGAARDTAFAKLREQERRAG